MSLLTLAKKITGTRAQKKSTISGKQAKVDKQPKSKPVAKFSQEPAAIDIYPMITEKSVRLQEGQVATFRVPARATKRQVAQAIVAKYGVQPKAIRLIVGQTKTRRRGATYGRTASWKKAYVQVADVQVLLNN